MLRNRLEKARLPAKVRGRLHADRHNPTVAGGRRPLPSSRPSLVRHCAQHAGYVIAIPVHGWGGWQIAMVV